MDDPLSDAPRNLEPTGPQTTHILTVTEAEAGQRLDKALAGLATGIPGLSRSRIAQAIADGRVRDSTGTVVTSPKHKVTAGERFEIVLPEPGPARPQPEVIALDIINEDADLIVVNKPAGMVVHPAPGTPSGTLVNALLAHCGDSLAGIGGERRPGIVHRIDKDTSGLLVVAKTEAAHQGLARLFASHDITREYQALVWGAPSPADPRLAGIQGLRLETSGWIRIETGLARHPHDRKRMAVARNGGRQAITRLKVMERFGPVEKPLASLLTCRLETGRTHQIRVHAAHVGHPLIGDQTYGRPRKISARIADPETIEAMTKFPRQALHAARLGFLHPVNGVEMNFHVNVPADINSLVTILRRNHEPAA